MGSKDMVDGRAGATGIALRLALFYGAAFAVVGLQVAFWPLWLRARGLTGAEIGLLLSMPMWVRVFGNPMVAAFADRSGERHRLMIGLAAGAVVAFALFWFAEGFWLLFGVTAVYAFLYTPLVPLGDNMAMLISSARGLDYGRLRLWGSLAFILATVIGGAVLVGRAPNLILWSILAAVAGTFVACLLLPGFRPPEDGSHPAGSGGDGGMFAVVRQPAFALFLLSASLIQASHAVLYGFGSLDWRAIGLEGEVIGWLWAEGVIAEIALFAFSGRVVRLVGPTGLLVLAGVAALVRWTAMGWSDDLGVLVAVQLLHGLTFGAAHLGAMHFIARALPVRMSARGQVLYSAVAMGIAFGLAMPLAGVLYEAFAGRAFYFMAVVAAGGTAGAVVLHRTWRRPVVTT